MDKVELVLNIAKLMLKVVQDIRNLADSVQAVCTAVTDGLSEPEKRSEPAAKTAIPLEKVRSVLAEKSQAGFTAEVRTIIADHGASRLSDIAPEEYEAVLREAEALGHE